MGRLIREIGEQMHTSFGSCRPATPQAFGGQMVLCEVASGEVVKISVLAAVWGWCTQEMGLAISRSGQARRRPRRGAPGSIASKSRHSSSVTSLAQRRPARLSCRPVAAVHIASFVQGVTTRSNHDAARRSSPHRLILNVIRDSLSRVTTIIRACGLLTRSAQIQNGSGE